NPANVVVVIDAFDHGLYVNIDEPAAAVTTVTEGATVTFRASAGTTRADNSVVVDPVSDVSWVYRPAAAPSSAATPLEDASGNNVGATLDSSSLPIGNWLVQARVSVQGSPVVESGARRVVVEPLTPAFTTSVVA